MANRPGIPSNRDRTGNNAAAIKKMVRSTMPLRKKSSRMCANKLARPRRRRGMKADAISELREILDQAGNSRRGRVALQRADLAPRLHGLARQLQRGLRHLPFCAIGAACEMCDAPAIEFTASKSI